MSKYISRYISKVKIYLKIYLKCQNISQDISQKSKYISPETISPSACCAAALPQEKGNFWTVPTNSDQLWILGKIQISNFQQHPAIVLANLKSISGKESLACLFEIELNCWPFYRLQTTKIQNNLLGLFLIKEICVMLRYVQTLQKIFLSDWVFICDICLCASLNQLLK